MNYLGHLFLSQNDPELLVGNFIADAVKASRWNRYPVRIGRGILLHRKIDAFTDQHESVKESIARARELFRKYAPVVVDIYYDYVLANSWSAYSDLEFSEFCEEVYHTLNAHRDVMPVRMQQRLPGMIENDWLGSYQYKEGLQYAFDRLQQRVSFPVKFARASDHLIHFLDRYDAEFGRFFPELIEMVKRESQIILRNEGKS